MKRGIPAAVWTPVMALALLTVTTDALAQLPISLRVSALYARQAATMSATVAGVDAGDFDTASNALGAEVRVGLPVVGFDLGAHYLRHFGDTDTEFGQDLSQDLQAIGLSANEFALFAEKRFELLPLSPVKPYLGIGASYARVELSSDIDVTAGVNSTGDITSSANLFRVYAVGGIEMLGGLGLVGRAGYAFSGEYELESDALGDTGIDADVLVDYDGYFVSVGLSLFGI